MPKSIPLSSGLAALVDDCDFDWINQWKWHARKCTSTGRFYAVRMGPKVNGRQETIRMHRVILGLAPNDPRFADHIIPDETLNNTRGNLRIATRSQNAMNRKLSSQSTTGYKGVCFFKRTNKWGAYIGCNRKRTYLGSFASPELAHAAYCRAAMQVHGEFSNSGEVEE